MKRWTVEELEALPHNAIARSLEYVNAIEAVALEQKVKDLEQKLKWAEYNRDHAIANEKEMRKRLKEKTLFEKVENGETI